MDQGVVYNLSIVEMVLSHAATARNTDELWEYNTETNSQPTVQYPGAETLRHSLSRITPSVVVMIWLKVQKKLFVCRQKKSFF